MSGTTYMRFELLRTLRNKRFFVFSLGFPVVLFYVIAGPQRRTRLVPAAPECARRSREGR